MRRTSFSVRLRWAIRAAIERILSPCSPGHPLQLRQPGHRPVFVQDLAEHAGRIEPGEDRQIDRRLGVSRPAQHAPLRRHQREDMPGAGEIVRPRARIDQDLDRHRPVVGGDAGRRSMDRIDAHRERRAELRRVPSAPSEEVRAPPAGPPAWERRRARGRGARGSSRACGVIFSAAMIRSPSFSRSSSSTTITMRPARISSNRLLDGCEGRITLLAHCSSARLLALRRIG